MDSFFFLRKKCPSLSEGKDDCGSLLKVIMSLQQMFDELFRLIIY